MARWYMSLCCFVALIALYATANAEDAKPLKVCLVSGSVEYKSNETLAELQKFLESKYPVKCSRAFLPGKEVDDLPGLENLDDCDVMLLFTRRLQLQGEQLERLKKYCQSGKPIVGVRTASHAIQTWLDFDKEVLGGDYQNHYKAGEPVQAKIAAGAESHPVLKGVAPFRSGGSLYKNPAVASDVTVLMTGVADGHSEPITWVREHKGGRVFYTSLGHPEDFAQESFRQLLVNAIFWTARRAK